jgi:hypothetical protein
MRRRGADQQGSHRSVCKLLHMLVVVEAVNALAADCRIAIQFREGVGGPERF